jgi:hypothetical protein
MAFATREHPPGTDSGARPLAHALTHIVQPGPEQIRGTVPPPDLTARASAVLGHDLAGVRVHQDDAQAAARGTRAMTTGQRIAFAPGEYRPDTEPGRRLLAHELAHVVQQSRGSRDGARASAGSADNRWQREADAASDAILGGGRPQSLSAAPPGLPQHAPAGASDPPLESLASPFAAVIGQEFAAPGAPSTIDVNVQLTLPRQAGRPAEKTTLVLHKPVLGATAITAYQVPLTDLYPTAAAAAEARGRRREDRQALSLAGSPAGPLAKMTLAAAPAPAAAPPSRRSAAPAADPGPATSAGAVQEAGPSPTEIPDVAFDAAGRPVGLVARSPEFGITTEFTTIAVGAGGTTVLRTPTGFSLIDAGVRLAGGKPDPEVLKYLLKRLPEINPSRVFEELMITHSHLDHVGALEAIGREFVIKKITINEAQLLDPQFLEQAINLGENQRKLIEEQLRTKHRARRAEWEAKPELTKLRVGGARDAAFEDWVREEAAAELRQVKPIQVEVLTAGGGTVDAAALGLGGIDIVPREATAPRAEGEGFSLTEYARSTLADPAFQERLEDLRQRRLTDPEARVAGSDTMASSYVMKLPNGNQLAVLPDIRTGDIGAIQKSLKAELARLDVNVEFRLFQMTHHVQQGFMGSREAARAEGAAAAAGMELSGVVRMSQLEKLTELLVSLTPQRPGAGAVDAVIVSVDPAKVDPALVYLLRSCGLGVYTARGERDVQFIEAVTAMGRRIAGIAEGGPHPGLRPSDPLLRRTSLALETLTEQERSAKETLAAERTQKAAEASTRKGELKAERLNLTKERTRLRDVRDRAQKAAKAPGKVQARLSQADRDAAFAKAEADLAAVSERIDTMDAEVAAIRAQGERLAPRVEALGKQIADIKTTRRAYLERIRSFSRSARESGQTSPALEEGAASPFHAEEVKLDALVRPVYEKALASGELPAVGETSLVILGKQAQTEEGRRLESDRAELAKLEARIQANDRPIEAHAEMAARIEAHIADLKARPDAADPAVVDEIEYLEKQRKTSQDVVQKAVAKGQKVVDRDPLTGAKTETTVISETTTEQAQKAEQAQPAEAAQPAEPAKREAGTPEELAEAAKGAPRAGLVQKGAAVVGRGMGGVMIFQNVSGAAGLLAKYGADQASPAETAIGVTKSAYGITIGYRMLTGAHVGMGEFAILSVLDVSQTMLADYASTEAFNTEVTYSLIRNAVDLACAAIGMFLIETGNPAGILAGLAVMFLGPKLLEWLGVHDWLAKKFDFRPDEYIDLENDLRKLITEYSLIVGAQELRDRSDTSLKALNQSSYVGGDPELSEYYPRDVRQAAAEFVESHRTSLQDNERKILKEFSAAYSRAKEGYSQLREIDDLRAQFTDLYLAAHRNDPAIRGPSTWGANINEQGQTIDRPLGVVTIKEVEQRFAADEGLLTQDDLPADRVPAMEQWSKMDSWIGKLEGYLYQTDPADIDWMKVKEAERNLSVMVSNARYRLKPQSAERRTPIIAPDSPARRPYEQLLAERENKLDQLRQRTVDVAIGRAVPTVLIEGYTAETEVGGVDIPPVYARPEYGDLTASRSLDAQLTAAQQTVEAYRAQIAHMPALPGGIAVEKLSSDLDTVQKYQDEAVHDGPFKSALFALQASSIAVSAVLTRVRQAAEKQTGASGDDSRVAALAESVRVAEQDRKVAGYLFLEELPGLQARITSARAARLGAVFGDTQGEQLTERERAAAATEELRGFHLGTITDRLVELGITLPDDPRMPIPAVFRLAAAPSVVVAADPSSLDSDRDVAGGEPMLHVVPVNPAAIAYYGSRDWMLVGAWSLRATSTADLAAITGAADRQRAPAP